MSSRKAPKDKGKEGKPPAGEEMIWSKQDEVNLKDQREYTIVIGRPGVFKLVLKRNEKGISLGIKRPVCLIKLVKGQDAKNGPVIEQQYKTRIGDSSRGDLLHVFAIREVPCTIYLRIWAMMPGGLSKMPFRASIFVLTDKDPNSLAVPAPSALSRSSRDNTGGARPKATIESAPKLTMTEQADVVISYVCAWLERRASSVAGLYRRAPPEGKTEELKRQFSLGAEVDLDAVEEPTIVAHAFKRWLSSNPPLLSYEFYNSFTAANATTDPQGRAAAISRVMDNLSPQTRASVMRLVLLIRAVDVAAKNPVDTAFLVSLFAPCFLRRFGDAVPQQPDGSGIAYSLLKFVIANSNLIFNTTSTVREEQARKIAPEEAASLERNLRESQVNSALSGAEKIQRDRTATQMAAATMNASGGLTGSGPNPSNNYTVSGSYNAAGLTPTSNYKVMLSLPASPPATVSAASGANYQLPVQLVAPPLAAASPPPSSVANPGTVPSPTSSPRPGDKSPRPGVYTNVPSFPAPPRPALDTVPPLAPTMTRQASPTKSNAMLAPTPVAPPPQTQAPPSMMNRNSEGGVDLDLERLVGQSPLQRQLTVPQLAQMLVDGKIEEVDLYLLAMPEQEANETLRLVREELSARLAQLNDP